MNFLLVCNLLLIVGYLLVGICWTFATIGPSYGWLINILSVLFWPILVVYSVIKWVTMTFFYLCGRMGEKILEMVWGFKL